MTWDGQDAMEQSQKDLVGLVWPVVRERAGGGVLISMETVATDSFAHDVDMIAGIDAWQKIDGVPGVGSVLRGVASRVQRPKPRQPTWHTFTVRKELPNGFPTEIHKRRAALNGKGFLTPHLTVQAYVRDGTLDVAAVAKTSEVIAAVSEDQVETNSQDNVTFFWVEFSQVHGCRWWTAKDGWSPGGDT